MNLPVLLAAACSWILYSVAAGILFGCYISVCSSVELSLNESVVLGLYSAFMFAIFSGYWISVACVGLFLAWRGWKKVAILLMLYAMHWVLFVFLVASPSVVESDEFFPAAVIGAMSVIVSELIMGWSRRRFFEGEGTPPIG